MAESEQQQRDDLITLYTYGVKPSWVIAVLAAFLFACTTLVHLAQVLLKRTWFMFTLLVGSFIEVMGYGFRAHGLHEKHPKLSTSVASSTFIIIAPAFIAATFYQLLAHAVLANEHGSSARILKASLGLGLGTLDLIAFALQAAGAAKLSDPFAPHLIATLEHGRNLVLAGNIINLLVLLTFLALIIYFHVSISLKPPPRGFYRLYAATCLLLIRVTYRIFAYSQDIIDHDRRAGKGGGDGRGGGLKESQLFHERWLYSFDALMIFLIAVMISAAYPSRTSLNEPERLDEAEGVLRYYFGFLGGVGAWLHQKKMDVGSCIAMIGRRSKA